jgi:hypothetical protein
MSRDLWHKAKLAPGEAPYQECRGAKTAPARDHGQKGRYAAQWDLTVNGKRVQKSRRFQTRTEADAHLTAIRRCAS